MATPFTVYKLIVLYMLQNTENTLTNSQISEFILDRELIIGRDEICDIVFDSSAVSHRHARIFTADGAVYLEDLSSQNGTCVNGLPIHMAVVLHSGDEISVGDAVFRFKF